ncbi:MAG: O-antigen ligase family protein [Candidatus Omnitrophica bacterium]|nr:O-antigen ligase family protein [Candidatus Omnitrophota bacterium]
MQLNTRSLEFGLLLYIVSFFLTLGSDFPHQVYARMWAGGTLFALSIPLIVKKIRTGIPQSFVVRFFLCFLAFELIRSLCLRGPYFVPSLVWFFYFGFFILSYFFFEERGRVRHLLWTLGGSGFFLALNAIPPFLIRGSSGYPLTNGTSAFFHPLFYSHETVAKYVMGRFAHANYTGDVIALGFFPALGLLFYSLNRLRRRKSHSKETAKVSMASLALPAIFVATTALAVIWIRSRGTVLCFSAAFLVYLFCLLLKFPSRTQMVSSFAALLLIAGFLIWAGDIQATWKELQTVEKEFDASRPASLSTNREGAKRALAIYGAHPLWGVGTGGYSKVSERFATPGTEQDAMVKFKAMSHYGQLLAEEGSGAFFYFLFLGSYLFEVARGLRKTQSRFQFTAGLSLFSAVLMVLLHASIQYLMQRYSISMLVYILMGASLRVLQPDFEHR